MEAPGALQKALAVNLHPAQYGSIVEIGAGQETARYFFRAGGAAGTVAKTMSAYDMTFSDAIYGRAPGGRYVSRARLGRMLEHEYGLLIERLEGRRETETTFFAYAATVAAQGYKHRSECHGWLGVRLQLDAGWPAQRHRAARAHAGRGCPRPAGGARHPGREPDLRRLQPCATRRETDREPGR